MEMVLSNGFCEMSQEEESFVNAGGALEGCVVFIGAVFTAWSPVAAFFCPPAGAGLAMTGLGLIGKGSGIY